SYVTAAWPSGTLLSTSSPVVVQRNSSCQKVLLWLLCTSSLGVCFGCFLYEHRRDHPKLPAAKRHVPGRHRKAHRPAALLPVTGRERPYPSVAGYAGQDCRRHGNRALPVFLRVRTQQRLQEPPATVRR